MSAGANFQDQDQTAPEEQSDQDLYCLSFRKSLRNMPNNTRIGLQGDSMP